ncbi:uncharacterized protein LOC108949305 [Ciona intestinalis]
MVHVRPLSEGLSSSETNSLSMFNCVIITYLSHTDTTGGGLGNSYPHQKEFAWNLLFLKQSWGIGKNTATHADKKAQERQTTVGSLKNIKSSHNPTRATSEAKSESDVTLPPLKRETSNKLGISVSRRDRKRRLTVSDRSRATLDSIPENEPLTSLRSNTTDGQLRKSERLKRHESKYSTTSSRQKKRASSRSDSQSSCKSASTSVRSGAISGLNSLDGSSACPTASRGSSSFYGSRSMNESSLSGSTRWDEHEGRPFHEKMSNNKTRGQSVVNCTIKPETLQKLVRAVSEPTRSSAPHLESPGVSYSFNRSLQMGRHQPFTNLNFAVEDSASKARLRSSLYKPEADLRRPTIFRSNKEKAKSSKLFNPKVHGDITRYKMVHRHAHKGPPDSLIPTKWVASNSKTNGPWAKYETTF